MTDQTLTQIGQATERVNDLTGLGIHRHRVDREITTAQRLFDRHRRIHLNRETSVTVTGPGIPTRKRDVHVTAELEHTERDADSINTANFKQSVLNLCRSHRAVDLDVDVLRLDPQDVVTDTATDQKRATAQLPDHIHSLIGVCRQHAFRLPERTSYVKSLHERIAETGITAPFPT